tara:strand:- start:408 stop:749 length:342 start_codon:yes stop_codon:yes gene_type:complete
MIFYIVKWTFIYIILIILIDKIYDFFRDTLTVPYVEKSFIQNSVKINNNINNDNINDNINDIHFLYTNLNQDLSQNLSENLSENNNKYNIIYNNDIDISYNMENELNNFIKQL